MKITETIERECCTTADLVLYKGSVNSYCNDKSISPVYFCKHCGQLFITVHDNVGDCNVLEKWSPSFSKIQSDCYKHNKVKL